MRSTNLAMRRHAWPKGTGDLLKRIDTALREQQNRADARAFLAQVRESDRLHRFLVDQSPDVIYMLDPEGRFSYVSVSAEAVFGRARDALEGHHWSMLFGPDEVRRGRFRFDERRTGHRATTHLKLQLQTSEDGMVRWIEISTTGLYTQDEERRFVGTYGVARDVTENRAREQSRLRLESQLQQARRLEAIGQLSGGIAHDFNNILASMIGYAELAQVTLAGTEAGARCEDYLAEVIGAGQRARDLVAQLLNISSSPEPEGPPAASRSPGAHVVVVDDEASVAQVMSELLEHAGYRTTVFNDPGTALEYLRSDSQVDLLITDQTMPQMSGIELAAAIEDLPSAPPVILCTGYGKALPDDASGDAHHNVHARLAKPFRLEELLDAVHRFLEVGAVVEHGRTRPLKQ